MQHSSPYSARPSRWSSTPASRDSPHTRRGRRKRRGRRGYYFFLLPSLLPLLPFPLLVEGSLTPFGAGKFAVSAGFILNIVVEGVNEGKGAAHIGYKRWIGYPQIRGPTKRWSLPD